VTPSTKTGRFWIMPPRLVLLLLVAAGVTHWALGAVPLLRSLPVGVALVAVALVLNVWADRAFARAQTPVRPDERPARLVLGGPFEFSRNPMYVGLISFLLGIALVVGSAPFWSAPAALWLLLTQVFVKHEERVLRARFGAEFDAYCERVPRWLIPPRWLAKRPPKGAPRSRGRDATPRSSTH
jgi:protein-S-isoprenylcysteine O-methyltransferase Ste14